MFWFQTEYMKFNPGQFDDIERTKRKERFKINTECNNCKKLHFYLSSFQFFSRTISCSGGLECVEFL